MSKKGFLPPLFDKDFAPKLDFESLVLGTVASGMPHTFTIHTTKPKTGDPKPIFFDIGAEYMPKGMGAKVEPCACPACAAGDKPKPVKYFDYSELELRLVAMMTAEVVNCYRVAEGLEPIPVHPGMKTHEIHDALPAAGTYCNTSKLVEHAMSGQIKSATEFLGKPLGYAGTKQPWGRYTVEHLTLCEHLFPKKEPVMHSSPLQAARAAWLEKRVAKRVAVAGEGTMLSENHALKPVERGRLLYHLKTTFGYDETMIEYLRWVVGDFALHTYVMATPLNPHLYAQVVGGEE